MNNVPRYFCFNSDSITATISSPSLWHGIRTEISLSEESISSLSEEDIFALNRRGKRTYPVTPNRITITKAIITESILL